jgi:Tfp pilus assembly protein PilX
MQRVLINCNSSKQCGATLVMALIVLVLIMMLGIAAVNTSNTQFKITANLQMEDTAFNNAELAVRSAENWLATNYQSTDFFTTQATPGIMQSTATNSPLTMGWTDADSVPVNGSARYTIQLMSINNVSSGSSAVVGKQTVGATNCSKYDTYLITGFGTSARGAKKFIQFYKPIPLC